MIRNLQFSRNSAGVMATTKPVEQTASATSIEPRASENVFSVQANLGGAANVITVEVSNDGVNWAACPGQAVGAGGAAVPTITANGVSVYMVQCRYFRLNLSTYVSGTVTAEVSIGSGWIR